MASLGDSSAPAAKPRKGRFLPYQERWLADKSRFKFAEKSRRIGLTYAQSYEDVRDAARSKEYGGMDVWFSSADESAAFEYIRYCATWAQMFDRAAQDLGEVVIDKKDDIKALVIQFSSGFRINGLSSNPKAFRSKGGKIVLDENAHHPDQEELSKAAGPAAMWGFPVRKISTHNGDGVMFFRELEEAKRDREEALKTGVTKPDSYSIHTITIEDAIADGLVDKILRRPATPEDIEGFLRSCRRMAGSEEAYLEEFMCIPRSSNSAWMDWTLITSGECKDAGKPELYCGGDVYVGWDVARRKDLSVIWVAERMGDVAWTREVIEMPRTSFKVMDQKFDDVMERYRVRRACIDQTGMGEKVVEDAQGRHPNLVEGVLFGGSVKLDMATRLKQYFEDRLIRMPPSRIIRDSHHAVRREVTAAGNVRFAAERDEETGHADHFWAHGLCLMAMDGTPRGGLVPYTPAQPRRFSDIKGAW